MGFGNGKVLKLEFNSLNQEKETSIVDQATRAAEYNNLM
jgi:outer membrane lipopolysaccharide assembly protein LptE/RlpB